MAITDLDEQLLVRAHQAGDELAFGQIVRSQHRALYAHAYRRLGNHEAAEDAVQDTLLRAYRSLPSFDGDLRLRAWLHRILTNVCHDESNRRRRQVGLIDKLEAQPVELAPDPMDEALLHDTVRVMTEALAELPESYREALVLRYVDGLSFREVAEVAGVSEENARARVHRGRLALHKVLSRVTLMLAFIIPGIRRGQKALDAGGDSSSAASTSDHTVSLSTQLASHLTQAAPVINRVAAEGSTFMAAKTSMVATAVAAVAAVAAPVAAYKVYDTATAPSHPAPAVAAPAADQPTHGSTTTVLTVGADGITTTTLASTTTSTLPPSAAHPFETGSFTSSHEPPPNTTTTPPPTTAPPGTVTGTLGGDSFDVTGTRPDFTLNGPAILKGKGDPVRGTLSGSVYVADTVGGEAITEMTFTLADGRSLRVRFRGTLDGEDRRSGATTWTMHGRYSIPGGDAFGLADVGNATVVFRDVDGAPSALSLDLQGQQHQ
ncbi:MAG: polymerase sigma-70 factor, subfamily [Actinomycetota bacterium]|nr:polymerase sigma-70 factor, subfamily [Actinomycetota bacterium]